MTGAHLRKYSYGHKIVIRQLLFICWNDILGCGIQIIVYHGHLY